MSLLTQTEAALRAIDCNYRSLELGVERVLVARLSTGCGTIDALFSSSFGDSILKLVGHTGHQVPRGAFPECQELTRLINERLPFGAFNIDSDDRLMLAGSTIVSRKLAPETVASMIGVVQAVASRFVPAYLSIVYGNEEAKAAFLHALAL